MQALTQLNHYISTTRFGKNRQASAECLSGVFLGAFSLGIYACGHRLGLSARTAQWLSGSSALFSTCLLGHGAYQLSRTTPATPKPTGETPQSKVSSDTLVAIIKDLFAGSEYTFDDLLTHPTKQNYHFSDLPCPIMKYFNSSHNLRIFIKVTATLSDQNIVQLKAKNPWLASDVSREINNVIAIYIDISDRDPTLLLRQGHLDSSLMDPKFGEADFTYLTDDNGKILETSQRTLNSLKDLIQKGQAEDTQGLVWKIVK
jgi:hypothetical protein